MPGHICPTCGYSFSQRKTLNRHIASVHGDRPRFSCFFCDESFNRNDIRRRHEQTTHGDDDLSLVSCAVCGKSVRPRSLKQHSTSVACTVAAQQRQQHAVEPRHGAGTRKESALLFTDEPLHPVLQPYPSHPDPLLIAAFTYDALVRDLAPVNGKISWKPSHDAFANVLGHKTRLYRTLSHELSHLPIASADWKARLFPAMAILASIEENTGNRAACLIHFQMIKESLLPRECHISIAAAARLSTSAWEAVGSDLAVVRRTFASLLRSWRTTSKAPISDDEAMNSPKTMFMRFEQTILAQWRGLLLEKEETLNLALEDIL